MARIVSLKYEDIEAKIEVEEPEQGGYANRTARIEAIDIKSQMEPLIKIGEYISRQLRELSPTETELSFGIKASAEGSFLCFAKAGVESQFSVTMKWTKE